MRARLLPSVLAALCLSAGAIFASDLRSWEPQTHPIEHEDLPLENWRKGVTAPDEIRIGTTPAVPAYEFSTTSQSIGIAITVPDDWDGSSDLALHLFCVLRGAETAADTIEWTLAWVAVRDSAAAYANGDGGAVSKTNSTATGSLAVVAGTGSAGLAANVVYQVPITLSRTDATNPYSGEYFIYGELTRTTVGGAGKVGTVAITGAHLQYLREP